MTQRTVPHQNSALARVARLSLYALVLTLAHGNSVRAEAAQDPLSALKIDGRRPAVGTSADALCSPTALLKRYESSLDMAVHERSTTIAATMQRMESALAAGQARIAAAEFSYCYSHYSTEADARPYAAAVGHFLTLAVTASHQAQTVDSQTAADLVRARLLLQFAGADRPDVTRDLKALDSFSPKNEPSTLGHDFRATARDLVTEYQTNELSFRSKYAGKAIEITGRARAISALPDGRSMVTIVGIERAPGHGRLNDELTCEIRDPGAQARAAQWKLPANVDVVGTYQLPTGFVAGIILKDCRPAGP